MNTAIRAAGHRSTCMWEGETHHSEYIEQDDEYFAVLGSINGASAMRMFSEHTSLLDCRTVERVVVLGEKRFLCTARTKPSRKWA